MTRKMNPSLDVPVSRGADAIANLENITGPGAAAAAQQAARQHVLVQEASKAIVVALGGYDFAGDEESFEFGGL